MDKLGHINVTKRLSVNLSRVGRFCFVLGSILPDIFVHTYIVGHKWETTFEKNCERLAGLEDWGGMDCVSYLRLGYIIHYIEDYFTYPHNTIFEDDMKAHIKYEKNFYAFLKELGETRVEAGDDNMSVEELCSWLEKTHKEYIEEPEHNHEVDFAYITRAAQKTAECMLAAFERNESRNVSIGRLYGAVDRRM